MIICAAGDIHGAVDQLYAASPPCQGRSVAPEAVISCVRLSGGSAIWPTAKRPRSKSFARAARLRVGEAEGIVPEQRFVVVAEVGEGVPTRESPSQARA